VTYQLDEGIFVRWDAHIVAITKLGERVAITKLGERVAFTKLGEQLAITKLGEQVAGNTTRMVIFCILAAVNRLSRISRKEESRWGKSESRWRNPKAAEESGKLLKKPVSRWGKSESHWRKRKAVEESRKPIGENRISCEENRILGEGNLDIGEGFHNISERFSSIGDSFPTCDWYYVCAWIWFNEIKYSQLKINHLNDMPSTKAVRDGLLLRQSEAGSQWCV
jgi:hypothetical protein